MKRSLKTWHAPLLAVALAIPLAASSAVNLTLDGMNSTLDNGVLKVRLGADGSAQEVWKGGST